jgi:hypothetical protein
VALRHLDRLQLDGARIGIDVDFGQGNSVVSDRAKFSTGE